MPTTRRQTAIAEGKIKPPQAPVARKKRRASSAVASSKPKSTQKKNVAKDVEMKEEPKTKTGAKRKPESQVDDIEKPASKKTKTKGKEDQAKTYQSGTSTLLSRPRLYSTFIHRYHRARTYLFLLSS